MMIWPWVIFIAFVLVMLALDLGVFHRHAHVISVKEALVWTAIWVAVALLFNVAVYYLYENHIFGIGQAVGHELGGGDAALQFFTGYLIEKSLSLDNIFVIALVFSYFSVPALYQHRVLFWGILGALIMRGLMIAAGTALIDRFDWIVYVFGGLLILSAVKMLVVRHDNLSPDNNPLVRLARKLYPVTKEFEGQKFFTKLDGKRAITPLFLVLLIVESTDLLFAVDSIPAIFAVTRDPFLVFTSNVFAILGLRSLYFALAGMMSKFRYLKMSLVFILAFVGVKMMLVHHHPIPTAVSLSVIIGTLVVGVLASLLAAGRDTAALVAPPLPEGAALGSPAVTLPSERQPSHGAGREAETMVGTAWRQARRVVVIVIGFTVLLFGAMLLVLPGPAFVVIPIGLAILGTEFLWARRLLKRVRKDGEAALRYLNPFRRTKKKDLESEP